MQRSIQEVVQLLLRELLSKRRIISWRSWLVSFLLVLLSTTGEARLIKNEQGGTGQDSSGWSGVVIVSGGTWSASATLGTSYITNDAIDTDKINAADSPVDGECVKVLSAAGKTFEFASCGAGGGEWTDSGTNGVVYASETDDEVVIGATSTQGAKFAVKGDADEVLVRIIKNGTQTNDILQIRDSTNTTTIISIDTDGDASFTTVTTANRETLDDGNYFFIYPDTSDTGTAFGGITGTFALGDTIESGSNKYCWFDSTSKIWCYPTPSGTATQALFATATQGESAFRAIAVGDLPTITMALGGAGTNISAYTGVLGLNSGTAVDVNTVSLLETRLGSVNLFSQSEAAGGYDFSNTQTECGTVFAGAMNCAGTNGCTGPSEYEGATTTIWRLEFFDGADDYGHFQLLLPKNFSSSSNITVQFAWYSDAATSGTVCFEAAAKGAADNETFINNAFGTGVGTTDTVSTTVGNQNISPIITLTSAQHGLSAGDYATFRVQRDVDGTATGCTSDTMADEAYLLWAEVCFETININSGEN